MAISVKFSKLFAEFVKNYKTNGAPTLWTWSKDQHHEKLGHHLTELLQIIEDYKEHFNDNTIINQHLNPLFLACAKKNNYVLQCWIQFGEKYYEDKPLYGNFEAIYNQSSTVDSSNDFSSELQQAHISLQNYAEKCKVVYQKDTTSLRDHISACEKQINALLIENNELKKKIRDQELFNSQQKRIPELEKSLHEMAEFLKQLKQLNQDESLCLEVSKKEIISPRGEATPPKVEIISPRGEATPPKVEIISPKVEETPLEVTGNHIPAAPTAPKIQQNTKTEPQGIKKQYSSFIDELTSNNKFIKNKSTLTTDTINPGIEVQKKN